MERIPHIKNMLLSVGSAAAMMLAAGWIMSPPAQGSPRPQMTMIVQAMSSARSSREADQRNDISIDRPPTGAQHEHTVSASGVDQ